MRARPTLRRCPLRSLITFFYAVTARADLPSRPSEGTCPERRLFPTSDARFIFIEIRSAARYTDSDRVLSHHICVTSFGN